MIILNTTYRCKNEKYTAFITHFTEKAGKLFCNAMIFCDTLPFCDASYTPKGVCVAASFTKEEYVDKNEFDIIHNFFTFENTTKIMESL